MAVHDYAWKADGSALSDHADFVRLLSEGGPGKRGANPEVGYRHGEWSDPDKWFRAVDLFLEVGVKHSSAHQHLSELELMLGKSTGHVTLQRVTPYAGTVEAEVELLGDPVPTQSRFVYMFPLRNPSGFWQDATATTASGTAPSITTSGDRPIDDMVITFSAPGSATHTDENGVTSVIAFDGTAGTAIVDCGERTITQGGNNIDADLTITRPWWWRFSPGAAQTITATVSITVDYKNKWAAG